MSESKNSSKMIALKAIIAIQKLTALTAVAAVLGGSLSSTPAVAAQGTWTAAPSEPVNGGPAFGLWLLTDGTVLSHSNALNNWCKLVPGADGNYADGTWVQLASSPWAMGGATERILNDGRFMETGAEYLYAEPSGYSSTNYNDVQIYDPVANTWTIGPAGFYTDIGDSGSAMLSNGNVFGSSRTTTAAEIYNPTTNAWTAAAGHSWGSGDEDAWTSLPNGGVFALCNTGSGVYNPATNTWTQIEFPSPFYPGDIGPTELMYDGRVLCLGYETTAIFTPGSTPSTGSWVNGPAYPGGATEDAEDEYGCCEPDGLVMFAAYPVGSGPNELVEFNPATNTFATITPPPDPVGPYALSLAGAGYMTAASNIIDTSKSFTVACWAKLNNTSAYEDFMTVDGTTTSAFYLQYNAGNGKISFNRLASDSDSAASTVAAETGTPATGTWYHVVGVYDATAKTIALYINGSLQQSVSYTTAWKGTGSTLVGRGKFSGNSTDYLNGWWTMRASTTAH